MAITKTAFGQLPTGEYVSLYTFTNNNHVTLTVTDHGGKMVNLWVPDHLGKLDDIILGFDGLDNYLIKNPYFGTLVGRCANRIRDARFSMNSREYILDANIDPHHLHGGTQGFDKRLWQSEIITEGNLQKLKLSIVSEDGDQGYPGTLWTTVYYSLDDENNLSIEYLARGDADTIVNLTNHNYFNLNGHGNGSVLNHLVWIGADFITDLDDDKIANGRLLEVKDTPFDFNTPHLIGERIEENCRLLRMTDGYDINYVLSRRSTDAPEKVCFVSEAISGRSITVYTTLPAMQLYTANYIVGNYTGKGGHIYQQYCGLCLETQYNPNSPNCPEFPSIILKKGDTHHSKTIYQLNF